MLKFIPSIFLRLRLFLISILFNSSGLTNFSHSWVPIGSHLKTYSAEYVLRWLPIGTHEWEKFVKPEELKSILIKNNLSLKKIDGMNFNILKDEWNVSKDLSVNYIAEFKKN